MAPERHALLGPSSAARWLACPPSARLEAAVPNEGTKYTREGTLAHAICELKLQSYFTVINKRTYSTRLNKLKKDELYAPEMEQHTDAYAEYIKEQSLSFASKPLVMIEDKVDFCRWVPEGFGTADCVMLHGDTLIVVDFKYGKGHAVSAVDNPQMKLYALGAYEKYRMLYSPTRIKMAIVQPRISDAPEEWETTLPELLKWAEETVKPAAALAFAGEGEQHGGDHCRFCRVKGQCRAYAAPYISAAEDFSKLDKPKEPALLTDEEIGNALTLAKPLAAWLSAVEDYALEAVLSGRTIPGWKAVEGRSVHRFTDTDAAFRALQANGVQEEMLYERKPLTLAQVEKLVGKKDFLRVAGSFVEKPLGKPTLAAESDPRPIYNPAEEDFQKLN